MRIALYIEDGLEQIVLTPSNGTERDILKKLHEGGREISIKAGEFYQCQGGWTRHGSGEHSTMIVMRPTTNREE